MKRRNLPKGVYVRKRNIPFNDSFDEFVREHNERLDERRRNMLSISYVKNGGY